VSPDGKGEHAAQPGQHALPLAGEQCEQNLGIGRGAEGDALRRQFPAKLVEIVDLAVEDDGGETVVLHPRLVGAGVQVKNGQATGGPRRYPHSPTPLPHRGHGYGMGGHSPDCVKC